MVGRPSLQRPTPEGLHASRGLAARARRHGKEEEEEEQRQDVPPELRRMTRAPAARSPHVDAYGTQRCTEGGRELVCEGLRKMYVMN